MEAQAEPPHHPDYDAAEYMTGANTQKHAVAPELRAHVARQMRDDAEVKKQLAKVRELKGAPSAKAPGVKK